MKFEPLNTEQHDLGLVSKLIYETELEIFRAILGKNETEGIKNIKSLINAGNNLFGLKTFTWLVMVTGEY